MATVGTLDVLLRLDPADFQRNIQEAQRRAQAFGADMQRMGRTLSTRVTLPLAAIGAASLKMAVDAEESANKFNVVMGGAADDVRNRFRDLQDVIPLTQTQMEGLAAGVQDLLVPLGFVREEAAGMSADMVELSADLASFNNVAADVPLEALKSALAGQSRPLRQFGIDVSQARLEVIALEEGLIEAGEALNASARAQAIMIAAQRDSSDAIGDAARTADSAANSFRFLKRDLAELSETIGQILIPAVVPIVRHLRDLLGWLRELDPATMKWVVGIAAAAAAIGPLLIVLGTLIKSLAALAVLVSPAGVILVGLAAVAALLAGKFIQAQIDAAREARELADALDSAAGQMRQLNEEGRRANLEQFQRGLLDARQRVEELQNQMDLFDSGRWRDTGMNLTEAQEGARRVAAELEQAKAQQESFTRLVQDARDAFFEQADAAGEVPPAIHEGNNAIERTAALLADALELEVEWQGLVTDSIRLRDELNAEIASGRLSLEQTVERTRERNRIERSLREHLERRVGLERESLQIAGQLTARITATEGVQERVAASAAAIANQYARINQQAEDFANQSIDWAQAFDDNWQTAIHSVGASLGGLASQIANVAGAFASGGAMAGLAAGAGMFLGEIFGQGVSRFEEAASEWEAALDDFVDMFADPSRWNRMRDQVQGAFDEHLTKAILSGFVDTAPQVQAWADTIQRVFTEIQDAEGIDAAIEAVTGIMQQLGASTEQIDALTQAYRDNIAAIEAQRQAAVGSMTEELQIRQLAAQGMDDAADAMRLEIERRKEMAEARELEDEALVELLRHTWEIEDAFREAADATRALREARDEELSLTEREAALRGDDRGALHARLQRQAEAELNALQDRLDAGRISEDHFQRVADIISGEVNQALADYEDQQRAAMQTLQDDIAVRELLVAGMDDEAAALRLEIRQRQELAEAMALAGDASDDLIERLRALHDAERDTVGRAVWEETERARARSGRARDDVAAVTAITEASALRLQDIGLSQLQRLTAIEFNTSALRGGAFQPSGVAGRPAQGGDTYNFSVSIHTTGDVTPAGARALGTEVVDQMDQRFGRKMRRDGRLAGDMGVPR